VVGVTAVDGEHRVLVEACRGEQVDFAARGADMKRRSPGARCLRARARHLVRRAHRRGAAGRRRFGARRRRARARAGEMDPCPRGISGKRGRDDIYGAGELGACRKRWPRVQ
jgi:hypothetical protein